MRFANKCFVAAVVIGLVALLAPFASAASVSYTTSTPVVNAITDWEEGGLKNLVFQKFDSSLGTLYQVDLNISASIITTLTVTNTAASGSQGTVRTSVDMTITDPLSLISLMPSMITTPVAFNLASGENVVIGPLTKSGGDSGSWTDSTILAAFTGTDTISLLAGTYTEALIGYNGGNSFASQETTASVTGIVTYYYYPPEVPEPASLSVLGSSLLGMLAFMRRRKS